MKIIIAGAGNVGTHLAKLLSREKQDIILMDDDEEKLSALSANFDLLTVAASPSSISGLKEVGVKEADLFIAVTPDGYCGDEDNGQTSAWYVFTALGFYPVCPGSNEYVMGAPYFKKATITLENGKKLEISAPKNNDDNRYIRSLNYNGKNYTKNYLNHFDLLKGGRLVFDMDNKPNKGRGVNESDFPYSFSRDAK